MVIYRFFIFLDMFGNFPNIIGTLTIISSFDLHKKYHIATAIIWQNNLLHFLKYGECYTIQHYNKSPSSQ